MFRRMMMASLICLAVIWSFKLCTPNLKLLSPVMLRDSPESRQVWNNLTHLASSMPSLSSSFTYAQRTIKTKRFDGHRPDMTVVNETFFPDPRPLDRTNLSNVEVTQLPPLTLYVPTTPRIDTGILSFGMATSLDRLPMALLQLKHWISQSGCPLHVIAQPKPSILLETQELYSKHGINLTVTESMLGLPIAYFSLLKILYENRLRDTKWLVLIDDDTYVPSLASLVQHLETNYDSSKEVLVGAATEDMHQVAAWGLIPYGGGGIFVSVPLAARLVLPHIWDTCVTGMGQDQGDGILSRCLFEHTSTRPTFSPLLHQMDYRGNASGVFESGRKMLTVHHWRSWFQVDMPKVGFVGKACGDEGILQRWMFPSSNLVLNNGFSITSYPGGVNDVDFEAVEKTWIGEASQFIHHIGPLRNVMTEPEKVTYSLEVAEEVEGIGIRQLYVKKDKVMDDRSRVDQVLELLWLY